VPDGPLRFEDALSCQSHIIAAGGRSYFLPGNCTSIGLNYLARMPLYDTIPCSRYYSLTQQLLKSSSYTLRQWRQIVLYDYLSSILVEVVNWLSLLSPSGPLNQNDHFHWQVTSQTTKTLRICQVLAVFFGSTKGPRTV
jgi:hypothetical protein